MNENRVQLIIYAVSQAILLAEKGIAAFQATNGRVPTLEEWKTLEASWKSPAQIEAEVHGEKAPGNGS